mmetsp:Transcript_49491/g.142405  ORF Transcript_49491/g.142405 Transcript_49491/m.142405 type:complete len:581 (-) Transcript_49491:911-2653(-)|eukprot:CAMPEP_0176030112 /NCGR_PEP_ID=MMETSP0120_2-20121206/14806_1 /TAXON_ID=160619 /ORGANISM="Kryptoperidinium foliaceum, Strain CCMP 1326" /LENGTH=580 /DNA_ID=CAMNT_0017363345 /DNA_START=106 /DNA_END=1848 /DNA_ORIENTATION=-
MKVETPQILWNCEADKGKNAPLFSVALQESGAVGGFTHVLATAGNANEINLWRVAFSAESVSKSVFQKSTKPLNQVEYITSLSRHDAVVNSVAFSPDGLHLATAGEAGSIILWSVPISKRGGGNGHHYWSTISKESDLSVRIVSTACEGVCDVSWSADSKRFVVGTIDSNVLIFEDKHYALNQESPQKESEWSVVFRNGEHSGFVQGVAYDPQGVYIASMGSDRTVRVFPRKTPSKSKKKVMRPSNAPRTIAPPQEHSQNVARLLTDSKLEMGKSKSIQRRCVHVAEDGQQTKQRLFVDESNCESFFRRLSWTADGLFLITPCALWHEDQHDDTPSFSTYLFARHRFGEPYKVLPGLEKPSVVVRPNPVLFEMPEAALEESKENQCLPYRSVFAVLTLDSVLIYDTYHNRPLSVARGLHYAGLTDCCWSKDGHNLMVCSSDGYISIFNFEKGELGNVYNPPDAVEAESSVTEPSCSKAAALRPNQPIVAPEDLPQIPPCDPGQSAVLEAPPAKRAKISDTADDANRLTPSKRLAPSEVEVGSAVDKLSLGNASTANDNNPVKKKKRVQPMLISNKESSEG